ncbi:E3 ubiquitin-protein ligase MIB2-like protein [Aphelenchoides avenae]|nr:E3 ubiquitin-protein ligase MIB2-like protein [Aphelenchus avenae]
MGKDDERVFKQLLERTREVGIEPPSFLRSKPSMEQFFGAVDIAEKQEIDTLTAQSRFAEAFSKVTDLRITEVNKASVENLSHSQCKQALLMACKVSCEVARLYHRQATLYIAFKDLAVHGAVQVSKLVEEAQPFVADYEKLKAEQTVAAKRYKDCDVKLLKEASELRKRLAQADQGLDALRNLNRELTNKLALLEEQLETALSKDTQLQEKVDELEEKLRCAICMDRPKDTVFACGHTCCKECAAEWNKCYYNCKSERRQKPIRHAFPLYLS